jgi:hypothetical protein
MAAAKKEKKPIMSCASSGHITKHKQSIFAPFDISDAEIGVLFIVMLNVIMLKVVDPIVIMLFSVNCFALKNKQLKNGCQISCIKFLYKDFKEIV